MDAAEDDHLRIDCLCGRWMVIRGPSAVAHFATRGGAELFVEARSLLEQLASPGENRVSIGIRQQAERIVRKTL